MKAVVCTGYGPPDVLELADLPKPTPKGNQVCVRIVATAVTASDSRIRGFRFPLWNPMILMFRLIIGVTRPRQPILGMVFAGEVDSVGQSVTRFKPGDEVFGMTGPGFGCYAEYNCVSERGCIVRKLAGVSYEEAAATTYGGLFASYCLDKGKIGNRRRVLVYGASGAIGTAAVQLAKQCGTEVTGVCSTANIGLVEAQGADAVLDYTRDAAIPDGTRYDLVFDAVGTDKTSALKHRCKAALTGEGQYLSVDDGMLKSRRTDLERISGLMESGDFKAVVDKVYPLDQIVEAHRHVDSGHKKGNVVIMV